MQFRLRIVSVESVEPAESNATMIPPAAEILPGATLVRVESTETAAARALLLPADAPGGSIGLDVTSPLQGATTLITLSPRTSITEAEALASSIARARATTLLLDVPAGTSERALREAARRVLDAYLSARRRLLLEVSAVAVPARSGSGIGSLLGLGLIGLGLVYLAVKKD